MKSKLLAACMIAGVVVVRSTAFAADLPRTGKFEFISCLAGKQNEITHGPNHIVGTVEMLGTQRSNPPGSLFDSTASRCVSSYSYIEGKDATDGFCEFVDGQGDRYLLKFNRLPGQGGTLEGLHGTGKYDGMKLHGMYDRTAPFPSTPGNVHACVKSTGDYSFQ